MQQQTGSAAMSLATLLAMPGMAGGELPVTGLALDSRQVRPGDLFLAVPGLHGDGRRHIDAALAAGAVAVLCEAEGFDPPTATTAPVVAIVALRQRLGELADRFNHSPSTQLRVTGVTGTNGKSSVCHELAQLLGSQGDNCAVIGTLGNGFLGQLAPTRHTTPD
ncbi:MAG TPA: Mur ligase domain-containing protein, partial [Pseudomonadales bacterium]|nr:Mur ligase domain-containing protein [Pseudomonadales bacterium]